MPSETFQQLPFTNICLLCYHTYVPIVRTIKISIKKGVIFMELASGSKEFNLYKDIQQRTGGEIYIGIVGPVRTGKSTFIKLLCRLYDPCEGQILLNGIDIRKYRYDDYRAAHCI